MSDVDELRSLRRQYSRKFKTQTNISESFSGNLILDTPDILYLYMHYSVVTFYIED